MPRTTPSAPFSPRSGSSLIKGPASTFSLTPLRFSTIRSPLDYRLLLHSVFQIWRRRWSPKYPPRVPRFLLHRLLLPRRLRRFVLRKAGPKSSLLLPRVPPQPLHQKSRNRQVENRRKLQLQLLRRRLMREMDRRRRKELRRRNDEVLKRYNFHGCVCVHEPRRAAKLFPFRHLIF